MALAEAAPVLWRTCVRLNLFQRRYTRLQPSKQKVGYPGEYSCDQSDHGSQTKANNFEPELCAQLAGPRIGDVAERGITMHVRIHLHNDDSSNNEQHDQHCAEPLTWVERIAGHCARGGQE